MACRYEEEIYRETGKMDNCGCPRCPYKSLNDCYEVKFNIDEEEEEGR
jgi:hypothetical protein